VPVAGATVRSRTKLAFAPQAVLEANYRAQYENAKQARLQFFEKAKHFIMSDDPAGFEAAVER